MSPSKMNLAGRKRWNRALSAAVVVLAGAAMGFQAAGQVTVQTIGGGVRTECKSQAGFISGNTYDTAQFNAPYACALDTNGDLWIADKGNNDIEEVTQAGNKADSVTSQIYEATKYFSTNASTHVVTTHYTTNYHAFTNVTGVAVDPANNLYILLPSPPQVMKAALTQDSTTINLLSVLVMTNYPSNAVATALAVDGSSNVFVAFTNGAIIRFQMLDVGSPPTLYVENYTNGSSPAVHYLVTNGFPWEPAGLAVRADGSLAVSDVLTNAIFVVSTNDYTSPANIGPQWLTGTNGAGFAEGSPQFAQFDQPHGLAAAADGSLIVCDTLNNRVRVIDTTTNTHTIYGTSSNLWTQTCCSCDPALYAGWVDGTFGFTSNSASGRLPTGVAIAPSNTLFVTELYYDLIREVTPVAYMPVNLDATYPVATTQPASSITSSTLLLNGTVFAGDQDTYYYFEWGTNAGTFINCTTTNLLTASLTISQPVSATINNLLPGTTYYYQLVALNGLSNSLGGQVSATTAAVPPIVNTLPATNITFSSASLQATVNPQYSPTEVTFQWGTTTNFGNTTAPIALNTKLSLTYPVSVTINALLEGTIYYFQAVGNSTGGTTAGATLLFSTVSGGVATLPPTNVTSDGASLLGSVNPGGSSALVYFQWGTTTNFGNLTPATNFTNNLTSNQTNAFALTGLQASTTYFYQVVVSNIGGTIYGNELSFVTSNLPPPLLSFNPSNGYFPECVTISVTSSVPTVFYTTDGTSPTTNSTEVQGMMASSASPGLYVGSLEWCQPLVNLSALQLLAYNGTNGSTFAQGGLTLTNYIGFPQPLAGGTAGHLYIPLVVELKNNAVLQSLQFRAEINPIGNAPAITSIALQPLTPNDFVPLPGPAPGNATVAFNLTAYPTSGGGQGLVIQAEGSSGLDMTGSGVVVMLHVQVPTTAAVGQSYSLNVLDPTGTSDGQQASVVLATLPAQTLTVSDPGYLVGDSSPSTGYNAGQFGIKGASNGVNEVALNNADVNNALYASVKIRVPPSDSDIYNSMDAYPPDSAGRGGDGAIRLYDWETILGRSLGVPIFPGMDLTNYLRFWTNGDVSVPSHAPYTNWMAGDEPQPLLLDDSRSPSSDPMATKLSLTNSPPGLVWFCQASITSDTIINALPGNTYSLPVYAVVLPGYNLAALQFRAIVSGSEGAPQVASIQFNPAAGIPAPLVLPGLAGNDKVQAWGFGSFSSPLQKTNYLGTISFAVPLGTPAQSCYALHFVGVDGAPDSPADYQFESHAGYVWVMSAALQPASITSDEWKTAFFGSFTNSQAADDVDADGDGSLNWQEFVAGTNPTNALSFLAFNSASVVTNGVRGVAVDWLTAPGKSYVLQSSAEPSGSSWTAINTNNGDGNEYQCIVTNSGGAPRFYRISLPQ